MTSTESFVDVSNLSASSLVTKATMELKTTLCSRELQNWDFVRDERGKTYEVMTHSFGRDVSTDEVRNHFRALGFAGNTAAFVAWVTKHKPDGYHASILDFGRLWRTADNTNLSTPFFKRNGDFLDLGLCSIEHKWGWGWIFVAFREVPK